MRSPRFWDNPPESPGLLARLLTPLGMIYAQMSALRLRNVEAARVAAPVICVGNLTAGGTGKTPTVIALLERLRGRNCDAHIISRGYGGKLAGPILVDSKNHSAADVGDEPLLLSAFAPVWVGADRVASARSAVDAGAKAIVMDDGFQNPGLAKDFSIVVIDASRGFGNGRVIPAGPLREPVDVGLSRADAVLVVGASTVRTACLATLPSSAPRAIEAELSPLQTGMEWSGLRALAFAGIGRPERFFATLRDQGVDVAAAQAFDDHAPYSAQVLARLEREATSIGAQLVTTEKDAARLPPAFRAKVLVLPVRLRVLDWSPVDAAFDRLGL